MRYKVGDRVRIRPDIEYYKSYSMDDCAETLVVTDSMAKLAGEVHEITSVKALRWVSYNGFGYTLDIPDNCFWTDGMLLDAEPITPLDGSEVPLTDFLT